MSLTEYKTHIACATGAAELHEIRGQAQFDGQLSEREKIAVSEAVSRRFAQLNHLAVGPQKPRWGKS